MPLKWIIERQIDKNDVVNWKTRTIFVYPAAKILNILVYEYCGQLRTCVDFLFLKGLGIAA